MSISDRRGVLYGFLGALYGVLNVATVTALVSTRIYHAIAPQNSTFPYLVVQNPISTTWDTMTNPGEEVTVQIKAVSNAPDYASALAILNAVVQVADGAVPSLSNHTVVVLRWEGNEVYPDPELVNGVPVWHAVATFRGLIDQVS